MVTRTESEVMEQVLENARAEADDANKVVLAMFEVRERVQNIVIRNGEIWLELKVKGGSIHSHLLGDVNLLGTRVS